MTVHLLFLLGFIFLDASSHFDGDEDGGSIIGLLEALGEIWWPLIGLILLVIALKDIFSKLFSKGGIFDFKDDNYISPNATIEERQIHADRHFENMKKYHEKGWHTQRKFYLEDYSKLMAKKNDTGYQYIEYTLNGISDNSVKNGSIDDNHQDVEDINFDTTNLAAYSNHLARTVYKEYKNSKGYITLKEYWTFDGSWRRGYWTGNYDKTDPNWRQTTKCDFLDTTMGDIHPE
jgi:hypothetical protein